MSIKIICWPLTRQYGTHNTYSRKMRGISNFYIKTGEFDNMKSIICVGLILTINTENLKKTNYTSNFN